MFDDQANSYWIRENDGQYELLVFNVWDDGTRDCSLFHAPDGYVENLLDEIRAGEREVLTYALVDDWYSLDANETWDETEPEYQQLVCEVEDGLWMVEEDWIAQNL